MSESSMSQSDIVKALNKELCRIKELNSSEENKDVKNYFMGKIQGIELAIDLLRYGKKCYTTACIN